jgi:hypothetical protein
MRTSTRDQPTPPWAGRRQSTNPEEIQRLDLVVDRNSEDASGLPWTFLDEVRDRTLIGEGARLIVGKGIVRAVARVVEVAGDVVRVRPLPGPVDEHRTLRSHPVA